MRHQLWITLAALLLLVQRAPAQETEPKVVLGNLKNPGNIVRGPGGKVFFSEFDAEDHYTLSVLDNGKAKQFSTGLHLGYGLAAYQNWLFLLDHDSKSILKIDPKGKPKVLAKYSAFPEPVDYLNHTTVDPESGMLYVSNQFFDTKKAGGIYRVNPAGKVEVVTNRQRFPWLHSPGPMVMDGASHLLVVDNANGWLCRVNITSGKGERITEDLRGCTAMTWDHHGQLFLRCKDKILGIPRPGEKPVPLAVKLDEPRGICPDPKGNSLLVTQGGKAQNIVSIPAVIPGWEVDTSSLKIETALAFRNMKWPDWEPTTPAGKPNEFRPLLLTHAGDGSNRNFVGTQHGIVYSFPNKPDAEKADIFFDLSERVYYNPNENEQGFLGMAFHPDFKKNGELYVFYTPKKSKTINHLSRFRLGKDEKRIDPASEEILLEIKRPFWNHDGGTVLFGPDGYLYLALGDGGSANDPFNNAQNLTQLLGHILRIDVNQKDDGKKYAIPKDNPFVGRKGVRPEIYAYGLRNVWRMAFDRKTGQLWAADVGQNLFEEINLIVKGGNYGWKLREGMHPFWSTGSGPRADLIEPIWEYDHDLGKSITGGFVYRGKQFPELQGHYLYADYVSGKIWALRYDSAKKRVIANRPIKDGNLPIMSWGEDEQGEGYLLTYSNFGQGIYRLVPSK